MKSQEWYESMTLPELLQMRLALLADRDGETERGFCDSRIALIESVILARDPKWSKGNDENC